MLHDGNAVGDRHRLLLIMGDDHEGSAEARLQLHQLELRFGAQLLVESRERFVEQEHLGSFRERTSESDPLALSARQLIGPLAREGLELHQRQHLGDAICDRALSQAVLFEAEGDVSLDREVRKESVALEHHVHRPPVGRNARQVLAAEEDSAMARHLESGQDAQQRGLAATRWSEQREELALVDVERQSVDRREFAEAFGDALEPHQRRVRRVRPWREVALQSRSFRPAGRARPISHLRLRFALFAIIGVWSTFGARRRASRPICAHALPDRGEARSAGRGRPAPR